MLQEKEKLITLKEAAKISGYAPDYIGQLIRKGKIPGKQVFCSVAWMTTENDIRKYMQKDQIQEKRHSFSEKIFEKIRQFKLKMTMQMELAKLFKTILYATIIFSVFSSLILFYIFSVSFEKKVEQRAIEKARANIILNIKNNDKE